MWEEKDRQALIKSCLNEHNASYCDCVDDKIFKEYDLESFNALEKRKDKELSEFIAASERECFED